MFGGGVREGKRRGGSPTPSQALKLWEVGGSFELCIRALIHIYMYLALIHSEMRRVGSGTPAVAETGSAAAHCEGQSPYRRGKGALTKSGFASRRTDLLSVYYACAFF